MKRRVGVAAAVAVVIAVVVVWILRGGGATGTPARQAPGAASRGAAAVVAPSRPDPRTLARGSIRGAVRDEAGAAIAHAQICADASSSQLPDALIRDPVCTTSDPQGRYQLGNLLAADYTVQAAAPRFRPGQFHPTPGSDRLYFPLAAGETRTGVDLVLRRGGVEITGVVRDVSGGPIGHARVRAGRQGLGVAVETDEQGRFSAWVDRGEVAILASADGYAPGFEGGTAPGSFEILLTPESSIAGTVVDAASGSPVAGARVTIASADGEPSGADITDAEGRFHVEHTPPGRFVATATTERGYGRSEASTLVGLGQHVEGVVVKLFPARQIAGKVVIASTHEVCLDAAVSLHDRVRDHRRQMQREPDGQLRVNGAVPGTYAVTVGCKGYQPRDRYDPVVVGGSDVTGLVWEVDAGARIRGKVTTRSGEPIEAAALWAQNVGGAARARDRFAMDRSRPDGRYELAGLAPGTYRIQVETERGIAPRDGVTVAVAAGETVERDLVLDDGGKLTGTVVDDAGRPVANVHIFAMPVDQGFTRMGRVRTDATGAFAIEGLRPGDYRVTAQRGWGEALRRPGTTDDTAQGEKATVRAGQTATIRLVVEAPHGAIRGVVVDAAGKPVSDAWVSSARESDAAGARTSNTAATRDDWWGDTRPVLTSTDGSFTLAELPPGKYTLRAYRKGGGEAVAEHVAVGATVTLAIKPTGSIEGTARRSAGAPLDELTISVRDVKTGFQRSDRFYMTGGHFLVTDLPAGHLEVTAEGEGSRKAIELDLGDGEARTGLDLVLEARITLTGRLVEYGTQRPVARMRVFAASPRDGGLSFSLDDSDSDNVSDEAGRFTVRNVPVGAIQIRALPRDWQVSEYEFFQTTRTVSGSATVDVGDLGVLKRRVKPGDPVGELGLHFATPPDGTPPDQREYQISWIDPAGPAARTGLQLGDVITGVDGVDVTGAGASMFWTLVRAAPGTRLTLGTRRGATVTLVLAP